MPDITIDGNSINGATIDGDEATSITIDGNEVWSKYPVMIEGFEQGLGHYVDVDSDYFSTEGFASYNSSNGLDIGVYGTTGGRTIGTEQRSLEAGGVYRVDIKLEWDTEQFFLYFGYEDMSNTLGQPYGDGYDIFYYHPSGDWDLNDTKNGTLATGNHTMTEGNWYDLEIDWRTNGDFYITMWDNNDNEVMSMSGNSTMRSQGYIAWEGAPDENESMAFYIDNLRRVA
jgi:hypothetical protein